MRQDEGVDFVITWVDGSDPDWQAERARYSPSGAADVRPERYRDWGLLPYWFRGVERFAPWVRTIHFVTWGHLPPWLDTAHPKLHIVRHEDYIPPEALPTFNSNALEVGLHRIPGLSERFVYFNDDMLLIAPTAREDFFVGGRPRDMLAFQPVIANPDNPVMSCILLNDSIVISRHFRKRAVMRAHAGAVFHIGYPPMYWIYNLLETAFPQYTGFYTPHGPAPLLRSSFEELWEKEPEVLTQTQRRRFRSREDVTQYLFREWEKQKGNFYPANLHRDYAYLDVTSPDGRWLDVIRRQKKKMVCINDTSVPIDFPQLRDRVLAALDEILPEPSSFEVKP